MVGGRSVWKAVLGPPPTPISGWNLDLDPSRDPLPDWAGLGCPLSPLTTDSWCAGMGCKRAIQAKRQPRSFVRKVSGCLLGDPGRRDGENMCTRKSKSRKFLCNYMVWCGMVAMNVNRKGVIYRKIGKTCIKNGFLRNNLFLYTKTVNEVVSLSKKVVNR